MCEVCKGYTGVSCPVCGKGSVKEKVCDKCHGLGHTGYYAFDIITREKVECTESAWLALPVDEDDAEYKNKRFCRMEVDVCTRCCGDGFVPET